MALPCFLFQVFLLVGVLALTTASAASEEKSSHPKPNIVFLVAESTDGRTWQRGYQNDVIPLPNIRKLQRNGYSFHRHYSNSPVCCTSRATFWSGRHAHNIPHVQRLKHTNSRTGNTNMKEMPVNGAWNNFEGLPHHFDQRMDQILERHAGYTTYLSGKQDWSTGGHSRNVQMGAWTMYTRFPYNVYDSGGWRLEEPIMCGDNGTVIPGNASAHKDDWQTLNTTIQWLKHYAQNDETVKDDYKPFFVYQGMNIAHPTYRTNEYYYNQIDPNKIQIPEWPPLEDIHPCDFQSSMLKGCIPPLNNATAREYYYSKDRIRNIRRIYYAMIAEFDAMVGAYMQAVQDIGAWDNTIFVVTSDHGDLQMEHQQMYKMVPYDASSSVPLVISDGRRENGVGDLSSAHIVDTPTQLIDIYPTIMDLAGVPIQYYPNDHLDGYSLVPFMTGSNSDKDMRQSHLQSTESLTHPDFVVSQFHGMNIAMSWFLIVRTMPCRARLASVRDTDANTTSMSTCAMKLVVWGTGNEVDSQLFDLTQDPDEMVNLIHDTAYSNFKASLEQTLRTVVDYPKVALDVARYNKDSMKNWIDVMGEPDWRDGIHTKLRWDDNWNRDSHAAFQALEDWLNKPDEILPCRGDLVWPPPPPLQEMGSITLE